MKTKKWNTKSLVIGIVICLTLVTVSAAVLNAVTNTTQAIEDNGYYANSGEFDKEKTPVTNMVILLKILNGSNLCDNDWYKEVRECISFLKKQTVENKKNKDEYVVEMMRLQAIIINVLHAISSNGLGKKATVEDIDQLQASFNAYQDYYYLHYGS